MNNRSFKSRAVFIIATFLLLTTVDIIAQLKVAVLSGINRTRTISEYAPFEWEMRTRVHIGVRLEKRFGNIGLMASPRYSNISLGKEGSSFNLELDYISLPIHFFYHPIEMIRLGVGFEVRMKTRQDGLNPLQSDNLFDKYDYGLTALIEGFVSKKISISAELYYGLNFNGEYYLSNFNSFELEKFKTNKLMVLQLNLNYYLSKV